MEQKTHIQLLWAISSHEKNNLIAQQDFTPFRIYNMGLGSYKKVGYSVKGKLTSIHTQAKLKHKHENKRETTFQGKKTLFGSFFGQSNTIVFTRYHHSTVP